MPRAQIAEAKGEPRSHRSTKKAPLSVSWCQNDHANLPIAEKALRKPAGRH